MHQAARVGCLIFRLNMQESSLLYFIKMISVENTNFLKKIFLEMTNCILKNAL